VLLDSVLPSRRCLYTGTILPRPSDDLACGEPGVLNSGTRSTGPLSYDVTSLFAMPFSDLPWPQREGACHLYLAACERGRVAVAGVVSILFWGSRG